MHPSLAINEMLCIKDQSFCEEIVREGECSETFFIQESISLLYIHLLLKKFGRFVIRRKKRIKKRIKIIQRILTVL